MFATPVRGCGQAGFGRLRALIRPLVQLLGAFSGLNVVTLLGATMLRPGSAARMVSAKYEGASSLSDLTADSDIR
jgi:hypothetical protein